jgi:5'-3' exonuclease
MGVPSYFAWLIRNQPNIISDELQISGNSKDSQKADILYLDLNCAIHPAVKSRPMTIDEMPDAVWQYMLKIITKVNPTKQLYIAIDGVAPLAKMKQQRARRYKSVLDKNLKEQLERKHNVKSTPSEHDFNMISPGTEFMTDLSIYLKQKISETQWSFKTIFSDSSEPGEGEHKIMDHIRTRTKLDDKIVIYGLDSDLIFLCLCNNRQNMALVRERQFFEPDYDEDLLSYSYLLIHVLKKELITVLSSTTSLSHLKTENILRVRYHPQETLNKYNLLRNETQPERLITDYVFICFLLGNDFLPTVPSLTIRDGGLDQLLICYKITHYESNNGFLINLDKSINCNNLKMLLMKLSEIEKQFLQNRTKSRHARMSNRRKNKISKPNFEQEFDMLNWVEDYDPCHIDLGFDGKSRNPDSWKLIYYQKAFHVPIEYLRESSQYQKRVTKEYLRGIMWTWNYYTTDPRKLNQDWQYPFEHAPLISDINSFLTEEELSLSFDCVLSKDLQNIRTPVEQLLSILPPQSCKLLPDSISKLMTDPHYGLIHMFPMNVELDHSFKRLRWEAHPILPPIEPGLIKRVVKIYENFISYEEKDRLFK